MLQQHSLAAPVPIGTPQSCLWMAVKDAANVCKKRSAEQLHADGLTMGKVADILPWSAEVTAVTAYPMGSPESRRLFGVRRSNGMSEPCRLRWGEGYGVCDDEEPSESPRHFAASMDESVIVGYYTLKKCRSPVLPLPANLKERTKNYGKK